ncbi:hypothetical protein QKU48_gp0269 [Fadolivirus algeromassiliense]|jgi:archaellum component FlaC|uniref:Uncharacterized protein n=1 Tax=Fadolivirus FV1/VV64 TaxID=3070911 RepID=A0A7D3QTY9_9VIRU|nr:hypothetical protein QKU48_gp0269 [Fadolivirus algeromassiliense]QKF93727.1 hypothetical protein Fadolivirus_1_269 [Fadolivirus FV1/VV64]
MNNNDNIDYLKLIIEKLNAIENRINELDTKIEVIKQQINKCESSCKTMDEHINFVEETYQTLRTPLDFIKNKVNYLSGNDTDSRSLPQIKDK